MDATDKDATNNMMTEEEVTSGAICDFENIYGNVYIFNVETLVVNGDTDILKKGE